jgi:PAS domain S-box-containing protein
MKAKKVHLNETASRRKKAEALIKRNPLKTILPSSEAKILKLIHELEVHQIELEMQNEELQLAKKKIEELAKEKYIELYDYSPTGYLTISKNGEILELNHAAAQILGKERSPLINSQFAFFISESTRAEYNHFLERAFSSKEKETCDIIIEVNGQPQINVNIEGNVSHDGKFCILTLFNITEQKLFEHKIIENSANWQTTFDAIDDIIILLKPNFEIIEINKAGLSMKNKTREEVIGKKCHEIFHNTASPICSCPCKAALESKKYTKCEDTFDHRTCELIAFPIFDKNKNIQAFTHIIRDITDHKKLEAKLLKAKEKAEESDHLKSAFLANMSHEIRTPMNGILGFSSLLQESNLTGEQQQEYIKLIEKSGNRMLNIINDIIDISKIESGLMLINKKSVNISELIDNLYHFFNPETEHKGLNLVPINKLPSSKSIINSDPEKINSILTNLIKNAIKFTSQGAIEFGCEKKGKVLEFFVKDTGIGIPKDRQNAVFERFVQADIADKMARQGAGLGLAISKAYVKMLGGKIWLESEPGKGTTFYFTLPYTAELEAESAPTIQVLDKGNEPEIKNLKILIAEDDEISEKLIETELNIFSRETLVASTGIEAVDICRNNPDIDLILMDIQMPLMNGMEAIKKIREFNDKVIIIAQTAYALYGDRELFIGAGSNDYISKPIIKGKLYELIQKYFKN